MDIFLAICGFIGAWLLVAGPLFQASIELREEDLEVERIKEARHNLQDIPKISIWWWILPPVKVYLERKQNQERRIAFIDALTPEDAKALHSYMSKAVAWVYVSAGAFFLAVTETYNLDHELDLPLPIFWIAIAVMPILCIGNVILQTKRGMHLLKEKN